MTRRTISSVAVDRRRVLLLLRLFSFVLETLNQRQQDRDEQV
jgi:hypothetical protein